MRREDNRDIYETCVHKVAVRMSSMSDSFMELWIFLHLRLLHVKAGFICYRMVLTDLLTISVFG